MLVMKYPVLMRLIHWLMAVIILTLLAVGFLMTGWWSTRSFTGNLFFWHKSFGVLILILIIVRIGTRLYYRYQLPSMTMLPAFERILANHVHYLLYLLMIIMPLSGYLMSSFHPKSPGVPLFFVYLPNWFEKNQELASYFATVHYYAAYCLVLLLFLHISGVIKHRLFDNAENDSLRKMI